MIIVAPPPGDDVSENGVCLSKLVICARLMIDSQQAICPLESKKRHVIRREDELAAHDAQDASPGTESQFMIPKVRPDGH